MDTTFAKLFNSKNYRQIFKTLESMKSKNKPISVELTKNIERLTLQTLLNYIHKEERIPYYLFKVLNTLDLVFIQNVKVSIVKYVTNKKMADISQFIICNFNDISSVDNIFKYLEIQLEDILKKHSELPSDWNIDLRILIKTLILIKQKLCEYFFNKSLEPEPFSSALISIIKFEKNLASFFDHKLCCSSDIDFIENETLFHGKATSWSCIHKKILSILFIPNINLFFSYLLNPKTNINQEIIKNGIINGFIEFFKSLEIAFEEIQYFNEKKLFDELFCSADEILAKIVDKISPRTNIEDATVVISTLIFIQETFQEFIFRLSQNSDFEMIPQSFVSVQKIENQQSNLIEIFFKEQMISFQEPNQNYIGYIKSNYNIFKEMEGRFSSPTIDFLLEVAMSQLFSKITSIKINEKCLNQLISSISELEKILNHKKIIPYLAIIRDYLEYFQHIFRSNGDFLRFLKTSNNKFNITQILKALDDQRLAHELYCELGNHQTLTITG